MAFDPAPSRGTTAQHTVTYCTILEKNHFVRNNFFWERGRWDKNIGAHYTRRRRRRHFITIFILSDPMRNAHLHIFIQEKLICCLFFSRTKPKTTNSIGGHVTFKEKKKKKKNLGPLVLTFLASYILLPRLSFSLSLSRVCVRGRWVFRTNERKSCAAANSVREQG